MVFAKRSPRLDTSSTLVALPGVAISGGARLLNLSTTGACLELEGDLETGQSLEVKLAHPKLRVVPTLEGEVVWTREGRGTTQVGLRFRDAEEADRASRPFLTAEAGSCVFLEGSLVGFVVARGGTWSIFDPTGKRVGVAELKDGGFAVRGLGGSFVAKSLHDTAAWAIGTGNAPLKAEPTLAGWRGLSAPAAPAKTVTTAPPPVRPKPGQASRSKALAPTPKTTPKPRAVPQTRKCERRTTKAPVTPAPKPAAQTAAPARPTALIVGAVVAAGAGSAYLAYALWSLVFAYTA
jgi:hypothetical protein